MEDADPSPAGNEGPYSVLATAMYRGSCASRRQQRVSDGLLAVVQVIRHERVGCSHGWRENVVVEVLSA